MPWCPKCKTEYIEGVEVCADCHTPLVASLEEGSGDPDTETLTEEIYAADEGTDPQDGPEFREADGSHPPEDEDELSEEDLSRKLREHTSTYVRPEERYSDSRSSGYMLTIIGAAGTGCPCSYYDRCDPSFAGSCNAVCFLWCFGDFVYRFPDHGHFCTE